MPDKPKSLYVFSAEYSETIKTRGKSIPGTQSRTPKPHEVPIEQLQKNFDEFLEGTQQLLEKGAAAKGPFEVDTVEIEAQIGADGKIGFLGTGVGVEASASIKFVFKLCKTGP